MKKQDRETLCLECLYFQNGKWKTQPKWRLHINNNKDYILKKCLGEKRAESCISEHSLTAVTLESCKMMPYF